MSGLRVSELARLTIEAYRDPERTASIETFVAQYNPETLSVRYRANLHVPEVASGAAAPRWLNNQPGEVSVTLVLDGTDVGIMLPERLKGVPSVADRAARFLECCTKIDSESHEVPFLRIVWSADIAWSGYSHSPVFDCRLASVEITYQAFSRDGSPLHAELSASFVEQLDPQVEEARKATRSPDVTHTRTVKAGDTLPLLCREIYGSAGHYLRIAQINNLDDFRVLEPGTELVFPPYEKARR